MPKNAAVKSVTYSRAMGHVMIASQDTKFRATQRLAKHTVTANGTSDRNNFIPTKKKPIRRKGVAKCDKIFPNGGGGNIDQSYLLLS